MEGKDPNTYTLIHINMKIMCRKDKKCLYSNLGK